MAVDLPLDDKAKRMRDLLSSFYSPDASSSLSLINSSKSHPIDSLDSPSFDPDHYMNLMVRRSNLEGLLQRHVEMAAEIKNLDTDLQMLVYENYNKFITATDTIKRMKANVVVMESNMENLLEKIMSVQARSDTVNTSLFEKREHIEKMSRTRNLLRKLQFIYDLPMQLAKCIKFGAYADAVKYYTGALPVLEAYGESSFQDCKREAEEAISQIVKNLEARLSSDAEPVEKRAEAVLLLQKLNFPVDSLKTKLLEDKLHHFLSDLQMSTEEKDSALDLNRTDDSDYGTLTSKDGLTKASIDELAKTARAYRVIFPDSEKRLIDIVKALFTRRFETIQNRTKHRITPATLSSMLGAVWTDMSVLDDVLPEAALPYFCLEASRAAVNQYVLRSFTLLLDGVSGALINVQNDGHMVENMLEAALESGKQAVIQGGMDLLEDFRQLLGDNLDLLVKLRGLIIDWIQEGFQVFFKELNNQFLLFARGTKCTNDDGRLIDLVQVNQVHPGLVLVLAELSIIIEESAIPRITEEIAASFSGGGVRGFEDGPAFIPTDLCRLFHSAGEKFLHLYIKMKTQKISVLLRKRISTPNWIKHKEPREVHMFVDLLLQELQGVEREVKQVLPHGLTPKHNRSDSAGSNNSRNNPVRDDKANRANAHARGQLLESHLAKLFKQKLEIFTKVEYTQESVISTIVKLSLKSFQEFVRLQTFNRSGFQQIQLDVQFLRSPLKDIADDEAAIDFLLDEVCVAAAERCLDPIPLELPIIDKLIQAKLSKS